MARRSYLKLVGACGAVIKQIEFENAVLDITDQNEVAGIEFFDTTEIQTDAR